MSGELSSANSRHPWDWYVEERWVTHRLADFLPLDRGVTYLDPCCGSGNIVEALAERGHQAFGTDLFERYEGSRFLGIHDWMGDQRHLLEASNALSIFFNPPYSRQNGALVRGLAEKCIRRAIEVATHKVAALLPVKWLASKGRYKLFEQDHRPSGIYILCERPSMPPGDVIEQLGKRAHDGGKVDFMWVVWDLQAEPLPHAPTFWIPPRAPGRSDAVKLERAA